MVRTHITSTRVSAGTGPVVLAFKDPNLFEGIPENTKYDFLSTCPIHTKSGCGKREGAHLLVHGDLQNGSIRYWNYPED